MQDILPPLVRLESSTSNLLSLIDKRSETNHFYRATDGVLTTHHISLKSVSITEVVTNHEYQQLLRVGRHRLAVWRRVFSTALTGRRVS